MICGVFCIIFLRVWNALWYFVFYFCACGIHFLNRHVLDTVVILEEGNFPTTMVRPRRHTGPPEVPEQQAPYHSPVCQGGGAEEVAYSGGGDNGELGAGL